MAKQDDQGKMKFCKGCEMIKPISDYYKAGNSFQSRCKPCHVIYREHNRKLSLLNQDKKGGALKPPRTGKTGFQKLDQAKQDEIHKYLDTMPLSKLAERVGVNKSTFRTWKKRGHLIK